MKFFYLFGCRIPLTPPPPRDPEPSLDSLDTTLTLSTNTTTTSDEYHNNNNDIPESSSEVNNCMHDQSSSSTVGRSKPTKRKYNRRTHDNSENVERRRQRRRELPLQPQRDLSPELLTKISPARPVFLYRKRLELADVDKHQNRLLLTDTDRLREFLTEEEMERSKAEVIAVDEKGIEYNMTLSKWGEKKKSTVNLHTGWNRMVRDNRVSIYDYVDLWGFRRGSNNEFRFAVAFSKG